MNYNWINSREKFEPGPGFWTSDLQISSLALYHSSYIGSIDGTGLNLYLPSYLCVYNDMNIYLPRSCVWPWLVGLASSWAGLRCSASVLTSGWQPAKDSPPSLRDAQAVRDTRLPSAIPVAETVSSGRASVLEHKNHTFNYKPSNLGNKTCYPWNHGLQPRSFPASVAVPPASARVSTQWPFVPNVTQSRLLLIIKK